MRPPESTDDPTADVAAPSPAARKAVDGGIDTSIYPMPGFVTFAVADLARSKTWYVDVLGFVVLAELPGPGGAAALVHLRRHRYQDILLVPAAEEDDSDGWGRGVRYTVAAGNEDLSGRAEQGRANTAASAGLAAGRVEGPARTRWNTVDLLYTDPDGYQVVLSQPVTEASVGSEWSELVRHSARP